VRLLEGQTTPEVHLPVKGEVNMTKIEDALERVKEESFAFQKGRFKYWTSVDRISAFDGAIRLCQSLVRGDDEAKIFDLVRVIASNFGWVVVRPQAGSSWTNKPLREAGNG